MKIYNLSGYSLIALHVTVSGLMAPKHWGFLLGAAVALVYLVLILLVGGRNI
jgi:hypothetical protein